MKENIKLSKSTLKYIKNKKSLYMFLLFIVSTSLLSFIPLLVNQNGNYSWAPIAVSAFCLSMLTIFLFNILFVESKYNQLDLLLLAKAKTIKNVFFSKWMTIIIFSNIFIFLNSFSVSLIFSIYSSNYNLFIPIFFASFLSQNIFITILVLLFTLFNLVFKGRVSILIFTFSSIVILFFPSIGVKILSDIDNNKVNYNYGSNLTHSYAKLYTDVSGVTQKTLVEKTNYKRAKENISLNEKHFNWSNLNLLDWISGLELLAISNELSNRDIITKNNFNINENHFKLISNFFEQKPNMKIKGIYPVDIKPLFELNYLQIQEEFKNLYNSLIEKGYKDTGFVTTTSFVKNNDLWKNAPTNIKEILFASIGIKGNGDMLYWLRDKKILLQKNPDLFSWMSNKLSVSFSNMIEQIYKSDKSLFNITNIKEKNRNELISLKIFDEDYAPTKHDVIKFKDIIKFNGNFVEINGASKTKQELQTEFTNINNKTDWNNFIDKNTFHLKNLREVESKLRKISSSLKGYTFEPNKFNLSEFHYEYKNKTTTPIITTTISLFVSIWLIAMLLLLNIKKMNKANLKGF